MNRFLDKLVATRMPIYCATLLFTPLDRIGAANLAYEIETYLSKNISDASININDLIFLPFRDTNQTKIQGKNRAKKIYNLDIEQLNNSSAIVARLDGLAKDAGIAMEIGYAYGLGVPIGILVTDFLWEGCTSNDLEWPIDPILKIMCDFYYPSYQLQLLSKSYYFSNMKQEEVAIREFVPKCLNYFSSLPGRLDPCNPDNGLIYIDIMAGRYGWARTEQQKLAEQLKEKTPKVDTAQRFIPENLKTPEALKAGAKKDILAAQKASICIFSGDSIQMDAGSAALLGMCKALGKQIIFQYTSDICYKGDGGQIMKVNLMVEHAADHISRSQAESLKIVNNLAL
jgi:nucleoside 2-deoxyribosyltransferase